MNICVLGASGFIGKHLVATLSARGNSVTPGSLRDPAAAAELARGHDVLVNLSGEPIAGRWNAEVKKRIVQSRENATRSLVEHLATYDDRPKAFVSGSAIGYYGTSLDATFTEASPAGNDFLANVCAGWEREAQRARDLGMRVALIRTGLVLGRDGGALAKILPIFKTGAGGPVGSGKQWYSWVHIDDEVGIIVHAIQHGEGAYNATSPGPVQNSEFTHVLGSVVHRPAVMPAPAFALKMMFGEGATLVLDGQRVLPGHALVEGYTFKFPKLEDALADVVSGA